MEHRTSLCSRTILHSTIMLDTCHYTFIKTQRIYDTKRELECKRWILGDGDVSV